MARRTGWGDLSEAYKARLTRSAASGNLTGTPATTKARSTARTYWESGGDLRQARGHAISRLPATAREAVQRSVAGESTTADSRTLRQWRETAPSWIPESRGFMADDAAAALASLPPPDRWGPVHFQPHADGTWTMVVEGKGNAYDSSTELPDRASAQAVMSLLSGVGPDEEWDGWDEWDDWDNEEYDFDVADTDGAS